jgi:hypothetical protein
MTDNHKPGLASIDPIPIESRKPRAGPLIEPEEAIMIALQSIPAEWWGRVIRPDSLPVQAVLQAIERTGYKIVAR